jgi:hypothetical protein
MFENERGVWCDYPEDFNAELMPPNWQTAGTKGMWGSEMGQLWEPMPLPQHGRWAAPVAPVAPVPWADVDDMNGYTGSTTATDQDGSEGSKGRGKRNSKADGKPRRYRKGEERRQAPVPVVAAKFPGGRLSWMGRIVILAREPTSSRMMQKELRECAGVVPGLVGKVVEEIAPGFAMLMGDPVGNYFCQALLDVTPARELSILVDAVSESLVQIALSRHGTCAVQRLIHATVERAPELAPALTRGLMRSVVILTNDLHGHYVIQCCLDTLELTASGFILKAMRGHCLTIATHRQGCLVLQKCFDRPVDDALVSLAEEIAGVAGELAQDPFGNYVVQHVLKNGDRHSNVQRTIALNLIPNMIFLSTQKFSSNVVELCFSVADESTKKLMVQRLLDDVDGLSKLVKDQYGNYVVQSILTTSPQEQVELLLTAMRPALHELEGTQAGRRVLANFKKKCRLITSSAASAR